MLFISGSSLGQLHVFGEHALALQVREELATELEQLGGQFLLLLLHLLLLLFRLVDHVLRLLLGQEPALQQLVDLGLRESLAGRHLKELVKAAAGHLFARLRLQQTLGIG